MCMSCGCGEFNEAHKSGDITLDDLNRAALNANISLEQCADNIANSVKKVKASGQTRAAGQ